MILKMLDRVALFSNENWGRRVQANKAQREAKRLFTVAEMKGAQFIEIVFERRNVNITKLI